MGKGLTAETHDSSSTTGRKKRKWGAEGEIYTILQ